jgi:hypothetical protein
MCPRDVPSPHKEVIMAKPMPVPSSRNPLAALERLPGWWLGKAETRRLLARDALERRLDKVADEHLRAASEYEKRALDLVI